MNLWVAECHGLRQKRLRAEQRQRHMANPRIEIKIPNLALNRPQATCLLEGRDYTDHCKGTDMDGVQPLKLLIK